MVIGMLFDTVKNVSNFKFEVIIGLCSAFIIIYALWRKITGKKGTWTSVGKNRYVDVARDILRSDALDKMNSRLPLRHVEKQYTNQYKNYTEMEPQSFPFVKESRGEMECRRVLEAIFQKPFSKARPDFLRNEVTGGIYNLELDCFNSELKIAVEYHGQQHYNFVPYFHRNKDRFINQKYRDVLKRKLCEENGIFLVTVPYTVSVGDIENFLRRKLANFL